MERDERSDPFKKRTLLVTICANFHIFVEICRKRHRCRNIFSENFQKITKGYFPEMFCRCQWGSSAWRHTDGGGLPPGVRWGHVRHRFLRPTLSGILVASSWNEEQIVRNIFGSKSGISYSGKESIYPDSFREVWLTCVGHFLKVDCYLIVHSIISTVYCSQHCEKRSGKR